MKLVIKPDHIDGEHEIALDIDSEKEAFLVELITRIKEQKAEKVAHEFVEALLEVSTIQSSIADHETSETLKFGITLERIGKIITISDNVQKKLFPEMRIIPAMNYIIGAIRGGMTPYWTAFIIKMVFPHFVDKVDIPVDRLIALCRRYENTTWGRTALAIFSTKGGGKWWESFRFELLKEVQTRIRYDDQGQLTKKDVERLEKIQNGTAPEFAFDEDDDTQEKEWVFEVKDNSEE